MAVDFKIESFIKRVEARIRELNRTQADVFKEAGMTTGSLKSWREGRTPTIGRAFKLAEVLEMDPAVLILAVDDAAGEDVEIFDWKKRDRDRMLVHIRKEIPISLFPELIELLGYAGRVDELEP